MTKRQKGRLKKIEALGHQKDIRAISFLIRTLQNEKYFERLAAVEALINIGEPSVAPLIDAIPKTGSRQRSYIIEALDSLGDSRAVEPLISLLEFDVSNRANAVKALGNLQDDRAVYPIIAMLSDESASVRECSARTLGQLGNVDTVKPLIKMLKDESDLVRKAAANSLDYLGWKPENKINSADYYIAKQDWDECIPLGEIAVDPLIKMLEDSGYGILRNAAETLGKLGDTRATKSLIKLVKSGNSYEKKIAIAALGELGDRRNVKLLISELKGQNLQYVKCAIATALGKLGDDRAITPLIRIVTERGISIRLAAVIALGRIGDKRAVKPILQLLTDQHWRIREVAAQSLDNLGWKPETDKQRTLHLSAKNNTRTLDKGIMILIGEDEPDMRDLAAFTLRFAGYEVITATNGEEVVEYALYKQPDLILLDIRMPRMTGYEACRRIKEAEETKHIPVVFLSAKGQEAEIRDGMEAGAEEYLLKPFAPDQLTERVRSILYKVYQYE